MDFFHVCANDATGAKNGSAPGGHMVPAWGLSVDEMVGAWCRDPHLN